MRSPALHRAAAAWGRLSFAVVAGGGACACETFEALPSPPPPSEAGFVVSRPFPEIRALNDVAVIAFDAAAITAAYAVGTDGAVLAYDARGWRQETSVVSEDLESISGVVDGEGRETVLAVGGQGVVLRRDGGVWSLIPSPVTVTLFGVWVRSADDAFVVGDAGTVLRWDGAALVPLVDELLIDSGTDDPATGDDIVFPIADPLKSVMGNGADDVWTVGPRGVVYHYDGFRFARDPSETNRPLADVFTRAGIWAATTDGVLLRRRDDGWIDDCAELGASPQNCPFTAPSPVFLQGIWARGDNDVFAVGLSENLFHFQDGLWSLSLVEEQSELRAIDGAELPRPADAAEDFVTLREVLAVGAGGRIVRGPLVLPLPGETPIETRAAVATEED